MMRWLSCAAAVAALTMLAGCADSPSAEEPEAGYYLSLGDSLSVGMQPDESGSAVETDQGYTDALFRSRYGDDSAVEHVRLGCGGEDSTSFLEGGLADCEYEEGSQLAAAEAFLEANRGRVRLVTVGIGANNFVSCATGDDGALTTVIDQECVAKGLERLREDAPVIAQRLREAAGDDVEIIGMTYYNPLLAALLVDDVSERLSEGVDDDGGMPHSERARYTNGMLAELNGALSDAYSTEGIAIADVAARFETNDFEVPEDSETGLPANAQRICDLTWMCDTEVGPDIHTNEKGGQEIAEVFAEALGG